MIIDTRESTPESTARTRTDLRIAIAAIVLLVLLVLLLPEASTRTTPNTSTVASIPN